MRVTRDLDLAEECVQDAYAQALQVWAREGVPRRPGGWLTTAARRRAVDVIRRETTLRRLLPLVIEDLEPDGSTTPTYFPPPIPDDRLRLIFTCCHPALAPEAQVALTLRLLCGLTTAEVARAFLVSEATMAARITRAKKKISAARIPYRIPGPEQLPERVDQVLAVVHLLFTTGHTAPAGADLMRTDLVGRALDLARMLRQLLPDDGDVAGLLALFLLTDARRATRTDPAGDLVLLADQDRSRWDRDMIADGLALVEEALRQRPPGRYSVQAAVAALHAQAERAQDTDWAQIAGLYEVMLQRWPSPVIALNRAAAIGFAIGPGAGLRELDQLADEPRLATYPYLAATRADFLRQLGHTEAARMAYEEAMLLTDNEAEHRFLARRLAELDG